MALVGYGGWYYNLRIDEAPVGKLKTHALQYALTYLFSEGHVHHDGSPHDRKLVSVAL
jgi:hypothetical protein